MLEPQGRRLLLEALRPADGYRLAAAIGTTFSLDLMTMLTAPLAFALFECEDEEGRPRPDRLALLEAVRRHADHMAVFCQAGEIKVPAIDQQLLTYLEDAVVEVRSPSAGHLFHPKAWVLRLEPRSEPGPSIYRVVCMSRNLTFDRSWDTAVVLEGPKTDRKRAIGTNGRLADFVKALPTLAVQPVSEGILAEIDRMQAELRVVEFDCPEPFEEVAFWPLGLAGGESPFDYHVDRALIVSPFVTDAGLEAVTDTGSRHVLVTRPESLLGLRRETLDRFRAADAPPRTDGDVTPVVYALAEGAEPEAEDASDAEGGETSELSGLHAKLYVVDRGWDASVITGSANATTAAFHGNIEFLVELRGKRSRCGVETFLAPRDGVTTFRSLLREVPLPLEGGTTDAIRELLEERIRSAKCAVVDSLPELVITPAEDATYRLTLRIAPLVLPDAVGARCWPITLRDELSQSLPLIGGDVILGRLSMDSLTAFIAFEVKAVDESGAALASRFVLRVRSHGMPDGRRDHVLRSLINSSDRAVRFLLLLLGTPGEATGRDAVIDHSGERTPGATAIGSPAPQEVLESVLRCLSEAPERFDDVVAYVENLASREETRKLLPPGFMSVWTPIREACERMKVGQGQRG